jgi:putative NADH-flavin reductase
MLTAEAPEGQERYRTRGDGQLVTTGDVPRRYCDTSQIAYGDSALAILDEIERRRHSRHFVTVRY